MPIPPYDQGQEQNQARHQNKQHRRINPVTMGHGKSQKQGIETVHAFLQKFFALAR